MRLVWVLASVLVAVVHGDTTQNGSSNLRIHIPYSLFQEEGYDHRVAHFGVPTTYGGSLALTVYYADSDLCDSHVNVTGGYPSRAKDENGNMLPWPAPYILMVDRGGCTFVKKVRNAQHAGAAGVVIADNICLCSDAQCMQETNAAMCETAEPVMADDGSGSDISIPSFFMFKADADAVKAELEQDRPVLMELSWSLPTLDRVEYELWTTPTDVLSRDFLMDFQTIAEALGDRAYFTPHNYIHDGVLLHCLGDNGEISCYNLCTNHGRYCATDPDTDMDRGISGADVVRESLRRSCIWKSYGEADGVGSTWWDYIVQFAARCSSPDYFANEECINDVYEHAGVDSTKILRCMHDSGGLDSDGANALLDMEIYARSNRGVVVIPTVFVNEIPIREHLSLSTVFSNICAGFTFHKAPDICVTCATCHDLIDCVMEGQCRLDANDGAESQSFSSDEEDETAERNNDLLKNDTSDVLESEDSA